MKKIMAGLLLLLILPIVSADIIMPGQHSIQINNKITNINDFPDYVFVSGGLMCDFSVINSEGIIPGCYKFSNINVYAIPSSKFDEGVLNQLNNIEQSSGDSEVNNYISSLGGKKVIEDILHYTEVSDSDSTKTINNYYSVNLGQVKTKPDKSITECTIPFSLYIIISTTALIFIILILIRRRK